MRLALVVFSLLLAGCGGHGVTGGDSGPPPQSNFPGEPRTTVVASFGQPLLVSLWGSSSRDIWLVGGNSPPAEGGPPESQRIVHFHGDGWEDVQTPGTAYLETVWGAASNDVWAGGGKVGSGSVLHYDGMAWSEVAQLAQVVSAIWGSSASDVWFAGGFSVWHWDGQAIRSVPTPSAGEFLSLWGYSASDAWLGGTGFSSASGAPATGTLMHWDGAAWNPLQMPDQYINGLWGASPSDLWGAGSHGYPLHWNGATVDSVTKDYTSFGRIYGVSANDIWALGLCCWDQGPGQGWGAHYDGNQWTYLKLSVLGGALALWATPPGTYFALANNTLLRWP